MEYDTQNDISNAFIHNMSLVASPKRSLSKISGYRPHKVSQMESLPQTRVILPTTFTPSAPHLNDVPYSRRVNHFTRELANSSKMSQGVNKLRALGGSTFRIHFQTDDFWPLQARFRPQVPRRKRILRLRPYRAENTPSRPIWQVKQRWARLVLGSETAWESRVL